MNNKARQPQALALGVDIGSSKIALGAVDEYGDLTVAHEYSTRADRGPNLIIDELVSRIQEMQEKIHQKAGVLGVGVCGQVDMNSGVVRGAPNLPDWEDVPLKARLQEALGIPVVVANDVNVIALGEWSQSTKRGINDLVVVFVGTGVGGGIVTGGKLLGGHLGHAAEIGHSTIVVDGRKCSCGNHGCLEAYVGGWAIAERARGAVEEDPAAGSRLVELAGSAQEIEAETVAKVYTEGDEFAREIVEDTGHYLGAGMVGVVNSFNPHRLVLGGGVIEGIPQLIEMVEKHVRTYALHACTEELEIVRAGLGPEAGVIGGAVLARQTLVNEQVPSTPNKNKQGRLRRSDNA